VADACRVLPIMGEVYRARDTRLKRTVAIKVLPLHLAAQTEARERFEWANSSQPLLVAAGEQEVLLVACCYQEENKQAI
jgi:hypothetical protein